jgi:peptidoglycan/LPS O-acetylase OafA/YrhL
MVPRGYNKPGDTNSSLDLLGARGHVPCLDGLRGIAILMVMAMHFFCEGGEVAFRSDLPRFGPALSKLLIFGRHGVDLFFVLSGFLITGILLREKGSPHLYRNFYARRFLRIFPLYYASLFIVFVVVPAVSGLRPAHPLLYWLYASNMGELLGFRDFGQPEFVNLGHFWSLAVEEHFYVVWPALVCTLAEKNVARVCAGGVVVAFLLRLAFFSRGFTDTAFGFTLCRMDGLMIGALAAVLTENKITSGILPRCAQWVWWCCVPMVVAIVLWPRRLENVYPILYASKFTICGIFFGATLVVVLAARPWGLVRRVMESDVLRALGKYSYGLYVIHELIRPSLSRWLLAGRLSEQRPGTAVVLVFMVLGILVSFVCAYASYELFEKRILNLKRYFVYSSSARARSSGIPIPLPAASLVPEPVPLLEDKSCPAP